MLRPATERRRLTGRACFGMESLLLGGGRTIGLARMLRPATERRRLTGRACFGTESLLAEAGVGGCSALLLRLLTQAPRWSLNVMREGGGDRAVEY